MMCTEEEARKKWCPYVRTGEVDETCSSTLMGTWNCYMSKKKGKYKQNRNPKECRCIGSSCMMWRWGKDEHGQIFLNDTKMYGYCGLGGKP